LTAIPGTGYYPASLSEVPVNRTRVALCTLLAFSLSLSLAAQQTTTSSPQPLVLLQRSLSALGGAQTLTDVTLSGTARRIAGSDDDTGTAVLKALASGASRVDLILSSGQRSEIRNLSVTPPAGAWSGPDGISHTMAYHNLLTEPAWFSPAMAITHALSTSGYVATYVGQETRDSVAVQHLALSQSSSASEGAASLLRHLTQIDLYLDSSTLLPAAMAFTIHPDDNSLLDIPVEVRFSDYRAVNAAHVPFHVQQYINNSLFLDFQFQSATLNNGLAASTFSIQ
jgi:hypothetical protein